MRLFGYLVPGARSEALQDHLGYAAEQVRQASAPLSSAICVEGDAACWGTLQVRNVDGLLIALAGQPIWRGKVVRPDIAARATAEMADAYRAASEGLLATLEGAFALAVVDPAQRAALLAVDRMGIERITYATPDQNLLFATSATVVSRFPGARRGVRNQALYDFLFMHMVPSPATVYEQVHKLPPASALIYKDGVCRLIEYWKPRYDYARSRDFEALRSSLKTSLVTAVRASGVDEHTGAFLSGGLDSSTVTGMLGREPGRSVKTFTVGFGEAAYDELHYARIASRHFGCQAFEYHLTPGDIVDAFPRIAAAYDEPFGNSSAVPTLYCAKLAADNGVTHLLAGDGGDELFGGNERYAKQQVLGLYGRVPQPLRRVVLEPIAARTDAESRITPLRKMKSYIEQAKIPLPDRFETWNFVYREGRPRLLDPDFAASIDLDAPLRLMREVWSSASSDDILERMLQYDWRFTLADNDLRKVGTMCELAGVRVSFPMLHPDVVNLSTRVPPRMKMKNLELRTFFKRAMADFLPDEILRKTKHGFGLPFGVWLKTDERLGDLIYSLLSDLKKRRVVSAKFLTDLVDEHRAGHASYYGYAIWDLAMLEAWLAHHVDASAAIS